MKKRFNITVWIFLFIPYYISALNTTLETNNLFINGNFENCEISNEKRGEFLQSTINIAEYATTAEPGKAELPVYSQLVSLPKTGNFVLENLTYDYDEKTLNYPVQQFGWEDGIEKEKDFYQKNEWYPKEIVTISSPVIMRGYRFCQIAIAAVQYNPAKNIIRIIKNIDAEFTIDYKNNENPLIDTNSRYSSSFSKIATEHICGFEKSNIKNNGSYLIITPDACGNSLQLLADWKRKLGHEVTVTPLSEIGASPDNYDIKDYIQNAYDSWDVPPEFVILVGDVTGNFIIPSFYVDGYYNPYDVSDHPYALLEGTDYFPDIFIGRISIQSFMDLNTVINKIVQYEGTIIPGNWYDEALMISFIDSTSDMYSQYITKINVGAKLNNAGFGQVDFFTHPFNVGIPQLIDMIDDGYSLINFRGCGHTDCWTGWQGYHFLESSDIASLNNGCMLPMVTSITCSGGDFACADEDKCFGEVWLTEGSPTNPKAAIGFIGPSEWDTKTPWNNCMDMGIYQGITQEGLYRCGEMLLRGKMELYNNYPHNHAWGGSLDSDQFYFYVYNLLGDPGLQIWISEPGEITVLADDFISDKQNYVVAELDVDEEKSDFMVSLTRDGELITKAMTEENGGVTLFADFTVGTYQLTASKYGYLPETKIVEVYSEELFDLIDVSLMNDPIPGNNLEYEFTLYNAAQVTAENTIITIFSEYEEITILTDSIFIQNIPSSTNHTCGDLILYIDEVWQPGKIVNIEVQISSSIGNQTFIIPIEIVSPELVLSDFIVQNADTCLIQNHEDNIIINLTNTGSSSTDDFIATLVCINEKIQVTQNESDYNFIPIEETGSNLIPFTVLPEEVITGEIGQFELQIKQNDSLVQCIQFSIPIGLVSETSPTFSHYGYYAIECSDTGFFTAPIYNWIELDPALGGQGTLISGDYVTEDGYTKTLDIPFIFTYFGYFYETISISSSGWISMSEDLVYHRNKTIPSGCGPAAMIAPFWDNLQNGNIFIWCDENEHRFIVEWQEFENSYDPSVKETFEVILYNPEYYQTPSGDGEILFQYKNIENIDQDDNYATVGIENFNQTDGVLMTYSNIYAPTAHSLQNDTAILFTVNEGTKIPLLEVQPQQLEFDIPKDTTATEYLILSNTSTRELSYWIKVSHFVKDEGQKDGRSIENDFIISTTNSYYTGMPMDIIGYLYHNSPDEEPVYGVTLDFPDEVMVDDAYDISTLNYNGEVGFGAEVTWGYGNGDPVYTEGAKSFNVNVTIPDSVNSPININWIIDGDGTGSTPHSTEGYFTIDPSSNSYVWVLYPDDGETLVYNTDETIEWYTYGTIDNVNLYLTRDNCITWETLAENFPNSGEYLYTVTGELSDNCKIKVVNTDGTENDISGLFSINIFDITHPEDGDVLEYNKLDTLMWDFTGIYQEAVFEFSYDNGVTWEIINDSIPNLGMYEYFVPGPPSEECIFRISSPDYNISNISNGLFTILDSPVGWINVGDTTGLLYPGDDILIPVEVNSFAIEAGTYIAYVTIRSNIGQKIIIPVTLEVTCSTTNPESPVKKLSSHPNPFAYSTNISFYLQEINHEKTQIVIYNIKGQLVREIEVFDCIKGFNEIEWDGKNSNWKNVAPGLYFYQVKAGNEIIGTNKCLFIGD